MTEHPFTRETVPELQPEYLKEIEDRAIGLAREAGAILLDHFRRPLDVEYKSSNRRDPVTIADKRSEEFLRKALQREFPDHGIVAEEGENQGRADAEFAWVVDPLDGTTNFVNHLPLWACSVGLLYRGIPIIGAVFLPSVQREGGSILHARLGGGAFQDEEPISVAPDERPDQGKLVSFPSYYWRIYRFRAPLRRRVGIVRASGSTAYELASTAAGVFQYAVFTPPSAWDVAAGVLLVQEAGGTVLARSRAGWSPLAAFPGRDGGPPTLEEIQAWRAPVLAGNPQIAHFVAVNIQQRPRYWLRLRRYLQARWETMSRKENG